MQRKTLWLGALAISLGAGCPTRDISKLDPSPAIEYRQDIPVSVNRNVDILFVIDNSESMKQEQESLIRNFPRFIDVLSQIEGGLPNVHIGVVTSDVGIGAKYGDESNGCPDDGDNGIMRNTGFGGCQGPSNGVHYIEDIAGLPGQPRIRNYTGSLDSVFSCIANVGDQGCGVEQHLESMKRSLDGSRPENIGFLRADAYLAVLVLADEDDCSARDTEVFNPVPDTLDGPFGPFSSFRCTEFGVTCDGKTLPRSAADYMNCVPRGDSYLRHPSEYVQFLRTIKRDPSLILTAIIAGNPTPFGVELNTVDPQRPFPKLKPSCSSANGTADPAVRLRYFGDQQGKQNTFLSICVDDLSDAIVEIANLFKVVIGTRCLGGPVDITDIDPSMPGTQLNCHVADVQFPGTVNEKETTLPRCPMKDATTPDTSTVPCWWAQTNSDKCNSFPSHTELHIERGAGGEAPIGTHVIASCVVTTPTP